MWITELSKKLESANPETARLRLSCHKKILMLKKISSFAILLALSTSFIGCADNATVTTTDSDSNTMNNMSQDSSNNMNNMPEEEGVMVGGSKMVPSKNIVENASASQDHTTLVAAVTAAGLGETLSGAGPFTVFAPMNAAFEKLPKGTVENLLKPEMKADLTKVLTYHVVSGSMRSGDLKDGQKLKTVQGEELTIVNKDGKWMVRDAKGASANITTADVISSNGVTHVIDAVLMPKK